MTGLLHDVTGDYNLAFSVCISISALSALAIWRASPGKVRAVAGKAHRDAGELSTVATTKP